MKNELGMDDMKLERLRENMDGTRMSVNLSFEEYNGKMKMAMRYMLNDVADVGASVVDSVALKVEEVERGRRNHGQNCHDDKYLYPFLKITWVRKMMKSEVQSGVR